MGTIRYKDAHVCARAYLHMFHDFLMYAFLGMNMNDRSIFFKRLHLYSISNPAKPLVKKITSYMKM